MENRYLTIRDTLVVVLTLTTGAVDASSFTGLGNVFASVITGNLILLGVAAGTGMGKLALRAGVALGGYSIGVLVGAPVAAQTPAHPKYPSGPAWPSSVTVTLVAELCVLAAFSAGWEVSGGHPDTVLKQVLIAVLAIAMGMQAAAVRRLGQMSTTYLTSTLTGVLAGLVTSTKMEGLRRSVGVLIAIVVAAIPAAILAQHAPRWLPLLILAPLTFVIVASVARFEWVRDHVSRGVRR